METEQIIITKKIAKHGKQAVIILPKFLEHRLYPGILAQISISIIEQEGLSPAK